jgi:type I restriction enzyme, S subunit
MSDWKKYKLHELALDIAMGPFGSNIKTDNFRPSGVPVIRGQNLVEGGFENSDFVFITKEKAQSLKRSIAYPDELVFTHRGTLGQVGLVPRNKYPYYLVSQSQMRLSVKKDFVDPKYLYYFFKSSIGQRELLKNVSQVGVPAIASPTQSLKDVDITIPTLEVQNKIASILSSLDDKIELNRRMDQTLEQIAATLFKKYFVDDIDTLGQEVSLLEIANLLSGGTPKTSVKEFLDGDIAWISAKDVTPNNRSFILNTERKITSEGLNKSAAKLLPPFSTVITARGTVGNLCLLPSEMAISQSNYALKSKIEGADFFLFQLVQYKLEELQQNSYGTVFDTITTNTLRDLKVQIPHKDKIIELENEIRPLYEKILSNLKENNILSQIRDSLLPKLMSGEIDLSAIHQNEQLHAEVLS